MFLFAVGKIVIARWSHLCWFKCFCMCRRKRDGNTWTELHLANRWLSARAHERQKRQRRNRKNREHTWKMQSESVKMPKLKRRPKLSWSFSVFCLYLLLNLNVCKTRTREFHIRKRIFCLHVDKCESPFGAVLFRIKLSVSLALARAYFVGFNSHFARSFFLSFHE